MQEMPFKKIKKDGLYSYIHVTNRPLTSHIRNEPFKDILYKRQFHLTISLAEFLTEKCNRFTLIRSNPSLRAVSFLTPYVVSSWKYLLLANDELGLGIDHGFASAQLLHENDNRLFAIASLLQLSALPEDTFGDAYSQVTVFGIAPERGNELAAFLQSTTRPQLSSFLQGDEIFFHCKLSKRNWGHDAILIKSREDISQSLLAYQTIINPNN